MVTLPVVLLVMAVSLLFVVVLRVAQRMARKVIVEVGRCKWKKKKVVTIGAGAGSGPDWMAGSESIRELVQPDQKAKAWTWAWTWTWVGCPR